MRISASSIGGPYRYAWTEGNSSGVSLAAGVVRALRRGLELGLDALTLCDPLARTPCRLREARPILSGQP
jgi:hypothetical protein